MLDDADYNDFGYYSSDAVTPNIDSIANDGVVLSRFYSSAAVCTPTRAAMLTGKNPMRFGINRVWPNINPLYDGDYYFGARGLPADDYSVAEALGDNGYRTMHVGKWHLGTLHSRFWPGGHGFDDFWLDYSDPSLNEVRTLTPAGFAFQKVNWQAEFAADKIIGFINSELTKGEHIFVNWWPHEPHAVRQPNGDLFYVPPTFDADRFKQASGGRTLDLTTDRGKLLATLFALDEQIGRVLQRIEDAGLTDDTLVLVTSDNGGLGLATSPNRDLFEDKDSLFEGGIRVPFAARWPRRFAPGTHANMPLSSADVYPTLVGLIGGTVPNGLDGRDMSATLLRGEGVAVPMFFQHRRREWRGNDNEVPDDTYAMVFGCEKIIYTTGALSYYEVCDDPSEQNDLSRINPRRFEELTRMMFRERTNASLAYTAATLAAQVSLPSSERLNTSHDDMSVYAKIGPLAVTTNDKFNIYKRGQGVEVAVENGILKARISGVVEKIALPAYRTVELSAPMPRSGTHAIGFVVRGYLEGGSSLSLYIDGQLVDQVRAPGFSGLENGPSVFAIRSEEAPAILGDDKTILYGYRLFTNAVEPDQIR